MPTFEERVAAAEAAMGNLGATDQREIERFVHLYMSQYALDMVGPTPAAGASVVFGDMFEGDTSDPDFVRIYDELKAWHKARQPKE